jgi:NADPH:quinone reductase-like Zn-dependent oxidoreductase
MRFHEYGDPDVLRKEVMNQPEPGAGQVRIRVAATSFNGVDANIRSGGMRGLIPVKLPHIPGIDVSGTVDALGAGVDNVQVGDHVIGLLPMVADGAAAEYVVAPAGILTAAPTTIPLADAAALPLVALTAYQALFEHGRLTAGQRVLISGAGGAVGDYAVQLAKNAGAYVIATAGPRSSRRVEAAGADEVVDHTSTELETAITEPVDVALNLAPIDSAQLASMVTLVRPGGVIVNTTVWIPATSDDAHGVRSIDFFVRSDFLQLSELVASVDRGELHVEIAQRVPLSALSSVHTQAAAGGVSGKVIVLAPTDSS